MLDLIRRGLATAYEKGIGVEKDSALAAQLSSVAAKQEEKEARVLQAREQRKQARIERKPIPMPNVEDGAVGEQRTGSMSGGEFELFVRDLLQKNG